MRFKHAVTRVLLPSKFFLEMVPKEFVKLVQFVAEFVRDKICAMMASADEIINRSIIATLAFTTLALN